MDMSHAVDDQSECSPTTPPTYDDATFFDVSIDLLCCLGFDGYFSRLSTSWEHASGFSAAELTSQPFIEFVHPDDRERTLQQNRAVREGGQALAFENRYRHKDGSYRWLRWNATPQAGLETIYSVARDVTAWKQVEAEREQLVRELRTALAEVRRLKEIIPICSYCRKIRDEDQTWLSVESYIARHTDSRFSHGICPQCVSEHFEALDQ
ncbi:hypothetical protein BH09GEM1_BH09GEM1_41760 [soil metagenome]